jgi:SnoaL-like domain/Aspartyl protease
MAINYFLSRCVSTCIYELFKDLMAGKWSILVVALLPLLLGATLAFAQEELPLGRCDRLPVVKLRIGTSNFQFLVDTGATSILNLKSFSTGAAKDIHVSSWQGTAATSAREVSLPDLMLGSHRLQNLKLPAIDLSPIANACGGSIDGILGIDLLEQMGVTLDLRRRIARLGLEPQDAQAKYAEMELAMGPCHKAFNEGKAQELEACFDPEIILYNKWGEYRGRKQVMAYLQENFLRYAPNLRFNLKPHDVQIFGEALWYSYDYSIDLPARKVVGQGVAMCRKTDGRWRMLNMHNSVISPESLPASPQATH